MNEEQRAVLAAVGRLEESRSGPIDEYSVARTAGILDTDLSGQEYILRPERELIRRTFEQLEEAGMLRLDRTGYWRPRTTLAGRRALEAPPDTAPPAAVGRGAVPLDQAPSPAHEAGRPRGATREWPAWWPVALRFGQDPGALPLLAAIAVVGLVLAFVLTTLAIRAIGGADPTPTAPVAAVTSPTAPAGGVIVVTPTPDLAATPMTTADATTPTPRPPTATRAPLAPTATPRTGGPILIVANTEGLGAVLYATPNGERTEVAVSEGTELEDIGPDEQDSLGRTWKHVRTDWGFVGWLLEEYVVPAQ